MAERLDSKIEELVLKNLRLVYHLAKNYLGTYNDLEELASIGTIGLIKAAKSYDESKGIKFATYSSRCISNEILMFLRKQSKHLSDISLEDPINVDWDGNELTLIDILEASSTNFLDVLVEREFLERFINIILNVLTPRERLIMLYKIAGITQNFIATTLNISQSYISRLEKKLISKLKTYINYEEHFKEVYSMTIKNNSYRISFSSEDVKNFNTIFSTCLQNLTSYPSLPDFNVSCNKDRIVILLPAEPESFFFIAQVIKEIDNFSMTFVSDKNIQCSDDEEKVTDITEKSGVFKCETTPKISETSTLVINSERKENVDEANAEKKESCAKQIINYALKMKAFSVSQIRARFPEIPYNTMAAALRFAKRKGLFKSTTRGYYEVITNEDETPEYDAIKING